MRYDTAEKITFIAAFISFLLSVALWFNVFGNGNRDTAIFVGLWVPSILTLGLYGSIARRNR